MQGENILSHKAAAPRLWVYPSWVAQEQLSSSATSTPPFLPHPFLIPTATKKSSLILPPKETWNIFPAESQLTYWLDNPTGQKKACFIPLFSDSSPKKQAALWNTDFYLSQWNVDFYLFPAALPCPAGYTRPNFSSFCPFTIWDLQQARRLLNFSFPLIVMLPLFPSVSPFLLPRFSFIHLKASELYYSSTLYPAKTWGPAIVSFQHPEAVFPTSAITELTHGPDEEGFRSAHKTNRAPYKGQTDCKESESVFLLEFLWITITILLFIELVCHRVWLFFSALMIHHNVK